MRNILIALLFTAANWTLWAADLKIGSGTVYKNAELRKIAAGCVQIEHDNGTALIAWEDLPDAFIAALSTRQRRELLSLADITLKNGRRLQRCTLVFIGNSQVEINHLHGTEKVALSDLPGKLISVLSRSQLEKAVAPPGRKAVGSKNGDRIKDTGRKRPDGKTIYQGPKGGLYYINDDGRKVYIKSGK